MNHSIADGGCPTPAACRGARILLAVAVATTLLAVSATVGDWAWRSRRQSHRAAAWIHALNLSAPALWHPGSPQRHPESVHPAVELRFMAGIESPP